MDAVTTEWRAVQVKEKFGLLRFYWDPTEAAFDSGRVDSFPARPCFGSANAAYDAAPTRMRRRGQSPCLALGDGEHAQHILHGLASSQSKLRLTRGFVVGATGLEVAYGAVSQHRADRRRCFQTSLHKHG